jgi:hypothetical protein
MEEFLFDSFKERHQLWKLRGAQSVMVIKLWTKEDVKANHRDPYYKTRSCIDVDELRNIMNGFSQHNHFADEVRREYSRI